MSVYQVLGGHDAGSMDLNNVVPQPTSEGIKATRRIYSASGAIIDEGKYIELNFGIIDSVTAYQALLDLFGVKTALTNEVTVQVRDETFSWVRMNGTAVRPEAGKDVQWRRFFPRNVVILVKDLEAAA